MTTFAVYFGMKTTKAPILAFFFLFLFGLSVKGQDYPWLKNNNFMVEARGHFGFFYHHHFEMERFTKSYGAFEASFYQNTYGRNEWEAIYNYPYIGVTYYTSGLGHFNEAPAKLGRVHALYPFINYPLIRSEYAQLTFKLGIGLAYLTEHFDQFDNFYNFSIGSHLNAAANLSFEYRQKITPRFTAVASFGLTHFSNGSTKLPNYGLNTISGALGIAYYLRDPRLLLTPAKRPEYHPFEFDKKKWFSMELDYGIGFKNVSQTLGGDSIYYTVHDLSTRFLAQFTQCSRAGLGFSLVLDLSDQTLPDHGCDSLGTYVRVRNADGTSKKEYFNSVFEMTKPHLSLCYAMTMNRMSFYFEFGWPLKFSDKTDLSKGNLFQKVSCKYQIYDNIYANLSLMTHYGRADYLCFGIGYRFNQKYYLNHEKRTRRIPPGLRKRSLLFL